MFPRIPPWAAAEWRFLVYLNFPIVAAEVEPLLPAGLSLDSYEGETFVSVVAARCLKPRWRGLPVLSPEGFRRVWLQVYVRQGKRRGVYPLAEIYSFPALATLFSGRSRFGAVSIPIGSEVEFNPGESGSEGKIRYHWGEGLELSLETDGLPYPAEMWPYDAFFVDKRFTFYLRRGRLRAVAAERPTWFAWEGKNPRLSPLAARALAGERAGWLMGEPASTFLVKGGPVAFRQDLLR